MRTLKQLMDIMPSNLSTSGVYNLALLFGVKTPVSLHELLAVTAQFRKVVDAPLTIFVQNMALLPFPAEYKGANRGAAIKALTDNLRKLQPDIVGLCECFVDGERDTIKEELKEIYQYDVAPPDEWDLEQDGGLLLLSRYPVMAHHATIYRQCLGEDCLSNKGALHANVIVPGHPTGYDFFLSHLQSPNPEMPGLRNIGSGDTGWNKIQQQLDHLYSFISAYRDPQCPALLMGDLNVDGLNESQYAELLKRLGNPDDLWFVNGESGKGITYDSHGDFQGDRTIREIDDSVRHKEGERLDYFLSWSKDSLCKPLFPHTDVVVLKSSNRHQISDHYGLQTYQNCIAELDVDDRYVITGVSLNIHSFHCLNETGGPFPVISEIAGSDEMEFEIGCFSATGVVVMGEHKSKKDDVDTGEAYTFPGSAVVEFQGDPGQSLTVMVTGWEVDKTLGITTDKATLGPADKLLTRKYLMNLDPFSTVTFMLLGSGGEYAVTIAIHVDKYIPVGVD